MKAPCLSLSLSLALSLSLSLSLSRKEPLTTQQAVGGRRKGLNKLKPLVGSNFPVIAYDSSLFFVEGLRAFKGPPLRTSVEHCDRRPPTRVSCYVYCGVGRRFCGLSWSMPAVWLGRTRKKKNVGTQYLRRPRTIRLRISSRPRPLVTPWNWTLFRQLQEVTDIFLFSSYLIYTLQFVQLDIW